jgi:hypothetical protein
MMVARIGAALWPLIKWLVPWLGPRSGLSLAIMGTAGVLFIWAYTEHREAVSEAVAARDAHWQEQIRKANERHDRAIEEAREAADSTPPIPDSPDWAERLCQQSPTCRDRS